MGSGVTILGSQIAFHRNDAAMLGLGNEVQRATATLPATTTAAIFTVTGRCLVTQIVGEVTTVIQTQACNLKIASNPTAAGTSVDLCADLNVSAKAVATLFGISGVLADALLSGLSIPGQSQPVICQAGTIDLTTSATNTGSVKWTVRFLGLDADAQIVAA